MVLPRGNAPRSLAYRARALLLSYRRALACGRLAHGQDGGRRRYCPDLDELPILFSRQVQPAYICLPSKKWSGRGELHSRPPRSERGRLLLTSLPDGELALPDGLPPASVEFATSANPYLGGRDVKGHCQFADETSMMKTFFNVRLCGALRLASLALCLLPPSLISAEWRIHHTRHGVTCGTSDGYGPGYAPATTVTLTYKQTDGMWADEALKPAASIFWEKKTIVYASSWKQDKSECAEGVGFQFDLKEVEEVKKLLAMYASLPSFAITNVTRFYRAPGQTFQMDRVKREIRWLPTGNNDPVELKPKILQPMALSFLLDSLPLLSQQRDEHEAHAQRSQEEQKKRSEEKLRQLQVFMASEAGKRFCDEIGALRDKTGAKEVVEKRYLDVLLQAQQEEGLHFGNARNYEKAKNAYLNALTAHKDSNELTALKAQLEKELSDFKARFGIHFDERQSALTARLVPDE